MATLPTPELSFTPGGCPDCGQRTVALPAALPEIGDDFAWAPRDFDGLRLAMLEELAARFPQRQRWTPADHEVALVETLACALDQLADMLDRVHAEAYLETARRPASVRKLLALIGYDAIAAEKAAGRLDIGVDAVQDKTEAQALDDLWTAEPSLMEAARRAGPRLLRQQKRMVTLADYEWQIAQYPLVCQARAWDEWNGAWNVVHVAVALKHKLRLASSAMGADAQEVAALERWRGSILSDTPTCDEELQACVNALRMAGQQVVLHDAVRVGIDLTLQVRLESQYFHSEVKRDVLRALGNGPDGFFAEGALRFGQDVRYSDIVQRVMQIEGVQSIVFSRFARSGGADCTAAGVIRLDGIEIAVCDQIAASPIHGSLTVVCSGGLKG